MFYRYLPGDDGEGMRGGVEGLASGPRKDAGQGHHRPEGGAGSSAPTHCAKGRRVTVQGR